MEVVTPSAIGPRALRASASAFFAPGSDGPRATWTAKRGSAAGAGIWVTEAMTFGGGGTGAAEEATFGGAGAGVTVGGGMFRAGLRSGRYSGSALAGSDAAT